jgi:hypothetical protein
MDRKNLEKKNYPELRKLYLQIPLATRRLKPVTTKTEFIDELLKYHRQKSSPKKSTQKFETVSDIKLELKRLGIKEHEGIKVYTMKKDGLIKTLDFYRKGKSSKKSPKKVNTTSARHPKVDNPAFGEQSQIVNPKTSVTVLKLQLKKLGIKEYNGIKVYRMNKNQVLEALNNNRVLEALNNNQVTAALNKTNPELVQLKSELGAIEKLSGPISWYEFSYRGTKITLFGDLHKGRKTDCEAQNYSCVDIGYNYRARIPADKEQAQCYSISAYLDKLAEYNNKAGIITDIYLESAFVPADNTEKELAVKMNVNRDMHLRTARLPFGRCMLNNKNCIYAPHVRIHYMDIRKYHPKIVLGKRYLLNPQAKTYFKNKKINIAKSPIDLVIQSTNEVIAADQITNDYWELYYKLYFTETEYDKTMKQLSNKYPNNEVGNFYKGLLKQWNAVTSVRNGIRMHKIALQIKTLREQGKNEMAKKIENYIYQVMKNSIDENKDRMDMVQYLIRMEVSTPQIRSMITHYISGLTYFFSYSLDAYFLARMFKYLDNGLPTDSKVIVVYAGDAHIKNYVNFFTNVHPMKLNHQTVNENRTRCINNFTSHI